MAKHRASSNGEARAIDTASIVFGLVAIPVRVFSTSEHSHEIHFHLVHAGCGERLKQQYICPTHGEVERSEMAKGYQVNRSTIIELAQEELDALDAVTNDEIALAEFVPASSVDPIYVERTYYLGPDKGGDRPYRLLHDALQAAKLVGIANYAARGNAYVMMVRPYENGLAMHQLRYPDEIKPWSAIGIEDLPKPSAHELELARKLVDQLAHEEFDATAYRDEVKDRVRKLLDEKAKSGEAIEAPEAPAPRHIPDLMAALRASLGQKAEAAEKPAHRPAHARAGTASHRRAAARHRPRGGARTHH